MEYENQLLNSQQAKLLDKTVIDSGVDSCALMHRAAVSFVEELQYYFYNQKIEKVVIFFHHGNNGGDGVVIGHLLTDLGYDVKMYFTGDFKKISQQTAHFLNLYKDQLSYEIFNPDDINQKEYTLSADLIVDAIFGTGFHGELTGQPLIASKWMNDSSAEVAAVDIPTGICADNGMAAKNAVKANLTVTFGTFKIGQFAMPGCEYCGTLKKNNIGFTNEQIRRIKTDTAFIDGNFCKKKINELPCQGHKGTFGRLLIYAGSYGMSGAAVFSGTSAMLSGAGTVTMVSPEENYGIIGSTLPEAMQLPEKDSIGYLTECSAEHLIENQSKYQCVLIGPGLGRQKETTDLLRKVIENYAGPLVIDADGIYHLKELKAEITARHGQTVITPHDGEFSFLCDYLSKYSRIDSARKLADELKITVVLKGPHTIIASPNGQTGINTTGGAGLATGGSGDVLAGMITALLGRGMNPYDAACCAVYVHGRAGDITQNEGAWFSVTARRLLQNLPVAYGEITRKIDDCKKE